MTNDNKNLANVRTLSSMMLCGRTANDALIKRVIVSNNLQVKGYGNKSSELYDIKEVEAALQKYYDSRSLVAKQKKPVISPTLLSLKEEKIKREIEALCKDNEKKDLQIEQLKLKLIDYEEVMKYLTARKGVESAILRKIFLSEMPVAIPGLEPAKAREMGEKYFNEVMAAISKNIEDWEEEFTGEETNETK